MKLPPAFDERPFALQLTGLVVLTTVIGGVLGGLGGRYRARRETGDGAYEPA